MKIFRFKIVGIPLILLVFIGFFGCARIVAPTGGPKDVTPPKIVKCYPPNFSPNFKGNQFSVTFNKYVQIKQFNQEVLISPPMETFPDYKIKKKTLIVRLKGPLKPNTTYTVNFGQSIADITEGNILNNFSYVFSTGKHVDSLSLRGQVLSAEDHTPQKDITVMLYKNNNDTIPFRLLPLYAKPYYVSKTNKKGKFLFSGLADTTYLLFALKDMDYSLTYNLPTEEIAFSDSLVTPQYRQNPVFDSTLFKKLTNPKMKRDSVALIADSLSNMADSLVTHKLSQHILYLFQPLDTIPKLLKLSLIRKNTLQFVFNFPADSVKISSENYNPKEEWFKPEWNSGKDTLTWFLKEPHPDSLKFLVMNGLKDTLGFEELGVVPMEKLIVRKKKHEKVKVEYLIWNSNLQNNIKPGQKLEIVFDQPIGQMNLKSALLINDKDSIYNPPHYFADSIHRIVVFPFKVEPDKNYRLSIPDSTVFDWNGYYNRPIMVSLRSKKTKDYGVLKFTVTPENKQHYIFQVLAAKNKVVYTRYFSSNKEILIENVDPGTYTFRIIYDSNDNNKWDPGNYRHYEEPEKVIYYPKQISVRANWEIDENWSF
ncbi:MAG: Ig-like domain-containing protein [Bacteroidales bacterium]|nr:Ig-like domain-containing protein [Bacteroidales bacterium]